MTTKSSWAKIAGQPHSSATCWCLLIGEGNEMEKYIFGLCFPMGPADTGRPPREQGGGEERTSWVGRQVGYGAGPQGALLSR